MLVLTSDDYIFFLIENGLDLIIKLDLINGLN